LGRRKKHSTEFLLILGFHLGQYIFRGWDRAGCGLNDVFQLKLVMLLRLAEVALLLRRVAGRHSSCSQQGAQGERHDGMDGALSVQGILTSDTGSSWICWRPVK